MDSARREPSAKVDVRCIQTEGSLKANLGKLSIIGAVVAILMIPTALGAQIGGAINPGGHVGGAVSPGATVRGAVERGIPGPMHWPTK